MDENIDLAGILIDASLRKVAKKHGVDLSQLDPVRLVKLKDELRTKVREYATESLQKQNPEAFAKLERYRAERKREKETND